MSYWTSLLSWSDEQRKKATFLLPTDLHEDKCNQLQIINLFIIQILETNLSLKPWGHRECAFQTKLQKRKKRLGKVDLYFPWFSTQGNPRHLLVVQICPERNSRNFTILNRRWLNHYFPAPLLSNKCQGVKLMCNTGGDMVQCGGWSFSAGTSSNK